MTNLMTGDSIMTIVDGKITSTTVLGFMFKKHGSGEYFTIHTDNVPKTCPRRSDTIKTCVAASYVRTKNTAESIKVRKRKC